MTISIEEQVYLLLEASEKRLIYFYDIVKILDKIGSSPSLTPDQQSALYSSLTFLVEKYCITSVNKKVYIGLRKWFPNTLKPKRIRAHPIQSLLSSSPFQTSISVQQQDIFQKHTHKLTLDEIAHSYLLCPVQLMGLFHASTQQTFIPIHIYCYGGYSFIGYIHTEYKTIHGDKMTDFFQENALEPGDTMIIKKHDTDPVGIYIVTEWKKDMDTFIREKNYQIDPSIFENQNNFSVRDLIYIYVSVHKEETDRISLIQFVRQARLNVALSTIRTQISRFPGLSKQMISPGKLEEKKKIQLPTPVHDAPYLLSLIQSEDYIFKILSGADKPLSAAHITKKIATVLGIKPTFLSSLSFINPNDERIKRLEDGTFIIRKPEIVAEKKELSFPVAAQKSVEVKQIKKHVYEITIKIKYMRHYIFGGIIGILISSFIYFFL